MSFPSHVPSRDPKVEWHWSFAADMVGLNL